MQNLSSALRAAMVTEYGLARMMRLGCIRIFSGAQPDTADDAEQGTLLATITQDGLPFSYGFTAGGLQLKAGPVVGACQNDGQWVMTVTTTGTAGWWRFIWNGGDSGSAADYAPRIDGPIGEGLMLASTALTAADVVPVDSFFLFMPPNS